MTDLASFAGPNPRILHLDLQNLPNPHSRDSQLPSTSTLSSLAHTSNLPLLARLAPNLASLAFHHGDVVSLLDSPKFPERAPRSSKSPLHLFLSDHGSLFEAEERAETVSELGGCSDEAALFREGGGACELRNFAKSLPNQSLAQS